MFVQVITGQVNDTQGLSAAMERWRLDVRPGAIGFLGSTVGITDDSRFVALARFDSPDAARANSDRSEQASWWTQAEGCFSGPVTFHDCSEVDLYRDGGTDTAGFVQVMQGHADRARLRELDDRFEDRLAALRPDLLGSVRAWDGDEYIEAAYFSTEAAARAAESQDIPPDVAAELGDWQQAMGEVTYYDLTSPQLTS
ncbi:MAG TPA: hypothetical protein VGO78_25745 [Acidimicrobiales bacterium]|nr:hypothetical protein [Acidimicrobiales bacterium]